MDDVIIQAEAAKPKSEAQKKAEAAAAAAAAAAAEQAAAAQKAAEEQAGDCIVVESPYPLIGSVALNIMLAYAPFCNLV